MISPPGKGLDAVFGPGYGMEGFATEDGVDGVASGKVFAITSDSLATWNLGSAHELLHLLEFELDPASRERIQEVWREVGFVEGASGYPNAHEMFAYFGQWYLAGFGHVIREHSPEIYELCRELIADAQVDPLTLTDSTARASLQSLMSWFTRSRSHHAIRPGLRFNHACAGRDSGGSLGSSK